MDPSFLPTTQEIRAQFTAEIEAAGGELFDPFDDGERLYLRSLLPMTEEVKQRDTIQGGVALRVFGAHMRVSPYTFRRVCSNGAIMSRILDTHDIQRVEPVQAPGAVEGILREFRDTVVACCRPEVFSAQVNHMRAAMSTIASIGLDLLSHFNPGHDPEAIRAVMTIIERFEMEEDRSRFGLMNAVTSVARDTKDPERRWRLEALGGGIVTRIEAPPVPLDSGATLSLA